MANGNGKKPSAAVAKGALAGAAAAFAGSDKGYRAEEAFRDAIKAAKKAGCSEAECEKIIGSAVVTTVDRYGGEIAMSPKEPEERGLARTLSKISSARSSGEVKSPRHFVAGFASGLAEELKKESQG